MEEAAVAAVADVEHHAVDLAVDLEAHLVLAGLHHLGRCRGLPHLRHLVALLDHHVLEDLHFLPQILDLGAELGILRFKVTVGERRAREADQERRPQKRRGQRPPPEATPIAHETHCPLLFSLNLLLTPALCGRLPAENAKGQE